jgi:hypothetical protein
MSFASKLRTAIAKGLARNKIPIQIFQNQWGGGAAPMILVLYLVFY